MRNKEDLRVKRTYKLLSEALKKLMLIKEFDKITVNDICNEAMVHRTTFYTHFEDKQALLKYCLKEIESPFDNLNIKDYSDKGYKKYYTDVAWHILNNMAKNKEFYKILIKKNKDESFMSRIQEELTHKMNDNINMILNAGATLPIPSELISRFYAGACVNVLCWWIENDMPFSVDELLRYLEIVTQAIVPGV